MKILYLFLTYLLSFNLTNAQIIWEELEPHNAESIDIIYKTKDDRLIGYLHSTREPYVSDDLGITWNLLVKNGSIAFWSPSSSSIKEDNSGNLYISSSTVLYKIDEQVQELIPYITGSIADFIFTHDNQIIAITRDQLILYDQDGTFIKDFNINIGHVKSKLYAGPNDIHYGLILGELIKFDTNLTDVEANLGDFDGQKIVIDNQGRLYSESAYSDDGEDWIRYQDNLEGEVMMTNSGTLYLSGKRRNSSSNNLVYISEDRGHTFRLRDNSGIGFGDSYEFYPSGPNGLLVYFDGIHFPYGNRSSTIKSVTDDESDWITQETILAIGRPDANFVEVPKEGHVFIWTDSEMLFNSPSTNGWEKLAEDLSFIQSFENGLIASINGTVSTDGGQTWENYIPYNATWMGIKRGKIYLSNDYEVFVNTDQVNDWDYWDYYLKDPDCDIKTYQCDYTINEEYYTINNDFNCIEKHDLNQNLIDSHCLDESDQSLQALYTSYSKDIVYAIIRIESGNRKLIVSNEGELTFESYELPIQFFDSFQAYENFVLIHTKEEIFISTNFGKNWQNITPIHPDLLQINYVEIGWDNYLYIAAEGTPILRTAFPSLTHLEQLDLVSIDFEVFPNPTIQNISLQYNGNDKLMQYSIHDMQGRLIVNDKFDPLESIDVSHIESGIYTMTVQNENAFSTSKRLVITK